jgi:hypothetical protein
MVALLSLEEQRVLEPRDERASRQRSKTWSDAWPRRTRAAVQPDSVADADVVLPPHRWASGRRRGLMLAHPHFFLLASPLINPPRSGRAG